MQLVTERIDIHFSKETSFYLDEGNLQEKDFNFYTNLNGQYNFENTNLRSFPNLISQEIWP